MSRFGIRRRLKRALGRGRSDDERLSVRLRLPDGSEREVEAEPRYTLVMASQTLRTPIDTACPDGHCGLCVVDVLEAPPGSLSEVSDAERSAYREGHSAELPDSERLACHARVEGSGAFIGVRRVWTLESNL